MNGFAWLTITGAAAVAIAATPPPAPSPDKPAETRIPFVNHGGIYNWQATDRQTVYIQDRQRRWYRATLLTDCIDLDFARETIGFDAGPTDTLDRFSSIVVGHERCPLASLVASGPPPAKPRKAAKP